MSPSIILAVENIRSLHNIGSLFRTADAAGVSEIILSPLCGAPPRSEILKTALGATKHLPWSQPINFTHYLEQKQESGFELIALELTESAEDIFTAQIPYKVVLIVGHEREGVSSELLSLASRHFYIPMHSPVVHSLNVSNATAIALYELHRKLCYT